MEKEIRLLQWAETQPLMAQQRAAQAPPARAISILPTRWATRVAAVALVLIGGLVALAGGCRRPAIELPTELSVPGGTPIPVPVSAISSENADQVTQLACWGTGTNSVQQVVWSPDGKVLAQWSGDYKVRLWEVATGDELPTLGSTSGVAFSPDGKILAYANVSPARCDIVGGQILLRHIDTRGEVGAFSVWDDRGNLTGDVLSIAFSPDGKTLASGSYGDVGTTINLWAVAGERHLRTLSGHSDWVGSVAFSPDGRTLASGSYDTTIKLWDVATGRELRTLSGHGDWVGSVAFSPDGKTLASASGDHTVKLWDVTSGREVRTLSGHTWYLQSVVFSPDGKVLASASGDHTIKLWDAATGRELRTLSGHTGSVLGVAFSPDGRVVASGSRDGALCLWGVPGAISPMPAPTVPTPGTVSPTPAPAAQTPSTLSPALEDCLLGAIGTDLEEDDIRNTAGRIEWNYESVTAAHVRVKVQRDGHEWTAAMLRARCRPGEKSASTRWGSFIEYEYAFARDGDNCEMVLRYVVDHCVDIVVTCPETTPTPTAGCTPCPSVAPNNSLWHELCTLRGHTHPVRSVAFSPDGKMLASGSDDYTIRLWDVASGCERQTLIAYDEVEIVAFSPDGKSLVSGSYNYDTDSWTIMFWDVADGHGPQTVSVHAGELRALSPDSKTLATSGLDNIIQLWDVASGREIRTLSGPTDSVASIAFSPDGQMLAASRYGTIRYGMWPAGARCGR